MEETVTGSCRADGCSRYSQIAHKRSSSSSSSSLLVLQKEDRAGAKSSGRVGRRSIDFSRFRRSRSEAKSLPVGKFLVPFIPGGGHFSRRIIADHANGRTICSRYHYHYRLPVRILQPPAGSSPRDHVPIITYGNDRHRGSDNEQLQ